MKIISKALAVELREHHKKTRADREAKRLAGKKDAQAQLRRTIRARKAKKLAEEKDFQVQLQRAMRGVVEAACNCQLYVLYDESYFTPQVIEQLESIGIVLTSHQEREMHAISRVHLAHEKLQEAEKYLKIDFERESFQAYSKLLSGMIECLRETDGLNNSGTDPVDLSYRLLEPLYKSLDRRDVDTAARLIETLVQPGKTEVQASILFKNWPSDLLSDFIVSDELACALGEMSYPIYQIITRFKEDKKALEITQRDIHSKLGDHENSRSLDDRDVLCWADADLTTSASGFAGTLLWLTTPAGQEFITEFNLDVKVEMRYEGSSVDVRTSNLKYHEGYRPTVDDLLKVFLALGFECSVGPNSVKVQV